MAEQKDKRAKEAVKAAETHLRKLDDELPAALELAAQWKPGMLRSACTMPLDKLQQETEHVIAELGGEPWKIKPPKKAVAGEKDVPDHAKEAARRLPQLREELSKLARRRPPS